MKKYITAFFTFIGYVTSIFLMGAGIVFYIGYHKQQKVVESTVEFRDISMTPVATEPAIPPGQLTAPTPVISPSMPVRRSTTKSVRKPAPVSATTPPSKPVTMSAPVSAPVSVPVSAQEKTFVPAKKTAAKTPKAKPQKPTPKPAGLPPTSTLSFRVTDNGASPRTGRGIVNINQTTDLEQQVIRDLQLEAVRKAAETIRNPPVWESGVVKYLSGN